MLSHTPLGLGNPYRYEPDQRIPTLPIAGEPWRVRARTDAKTKRLHLHMWRGVKHETFELHLLGPAHPETHGPYGGTAKTKKMDTHLTELVANSEEFAEDLEWEIELPILEKYEEVTYWLDNESFESTRTFEVCALTWVPDEGQYLQFVGGLPIEVKASERQVLKNIRGQVYRIRFTLPLAPNDHVVGFGERFNSIDQRGKFLDAVVYEEYKGQGHRTYLPAPFGS